MNADLLKKILAKYLRFLRYGDHERPYRDWVVILVGTLILLVASASWSYFVFGSVSSEYVPAGQASSTAAVAKAPLEAVRSLFVERALERTRYLTEYHFVDPSH